MTNREPRHYRGIAKTTTIPPCVVSIADLHRLYADLSEKAKGALERHVASLQRPKERKEEEWEAMKKQICDNNGLTVIVIGSNGEQVVAQSATALADDQLPDRINFVTFNSFSSLQNYNITPLNRFRLVLDFTEPPNFGTYNPWDKPTPNGSVLEVIGADTTWATGVYEFVIAFFRARGRNRKWLHTATTFSLLNWIIGVPSALWVIYRLDAQFPSVFSGMHNTLRGAIYVYLFLLSLLIFRTIIAGFRWMFPLVELEGARSTSIRGILNFASSTLLLALVYDVLKTVFWK